MSELLQLLTMKPHPVIGGRFVGVALDDKGFVFCSKCHADELTIDDFYVRPSGRPSSWCKKCTRRYKNDALKAKKEAAIRTSEKQAAYKSRKAA